MSSDQRDGGIAWTDQTWNPVRGCSRVSEGCRNCYAESVAARFNGPGQPYEGLAKRVRSTTTDPWGAVTKRSLARWTGEVRFVAEHLADPLRWKRPRRVFVNSMSDLFHEKLSNEQIDQVFAVMALADRHTFQCLTKRPQRMLDYLSAPDVTHRIAKAADGVMVDLEHQSLESWAPVPGFEPYEASSHGRVRRGDTVLKEQINERFDRASVTLWRQNEPKTMWVHTLVLLAHRGAPGADQEACHRNGNQSDNRLANLRWGSRNENQQEKVRHGSAGGPAKLTREQAAEVRAACARGETQQTIADRYGVSRSLVSMIKDRKVWADAFAWPLPNVWLGVSCEDQATFDSRIADLMACPAAVQFLSIEPMLGPINIERFLYRASMFNYVWNDSPMSHDDHHERQWVIVGGESGPGARPCDVSWVRSIVAQCRDAGVACFVKQLGARPRLGDGPWHKASVLNTHPAMRNEIVLRDRKGGDLAEWPEDLRVRELPGGEP